MDADTAAVLRGLLVGIGQTSIPRDEISNIFSHVQMEAGKVGIEITAQAVEILRYDPQEAPS